MQTWITDKDFYKSASNLNRQHLQAQIYKAIHILASLLDVNDKLVKPKKNVKNHPASKLWVGHEKKLLEYIWVHLVWEWMHERGFNSEKNFRNYKFLLGILKECDKNVPSWVTDELIQTHRSVLIQKEIEKETKYLDKYHYECNLKYQSLDKIDVILKKIKTTHKYRNLWPDTPTNLKIRYDWKINEK